MELTFSFGGFSFQGEHSLRGLFASHRHLHSRTRGEEQALKRRRHQCVPKLPYMQAFLTSIPRSVPCIRKKADWALKWISDDRSCFGERLIAFAAVEGIFFSGAPPSSQPRTRRKRHLIFRSKRQARSRLFSGSRSVA